MKNISGYIYERKKCPFCSSVNISEGIGNHVDLKYPLLPICTNASIDEDIFVEFTICICEDCGLIMLKNIIDPIILYEFFHSDGIGTVWEKHYSNFVKLIEKFHKNGRVLEVGAGQGKLTKLLHNVYGKHVEVVDPMYFGPTDVAMVHPFLFSREFSSNFVGEFQSIVSSHTLEHFLEFDEYFQSSHEALKDGGFLFTSVPNQEINFARGYGNILNFEHPSMCTNIHWIALHGKHGFVLRDVSFYSDHSIQIVGEKSNETIGYNVDTKELSYKLIDQYELSIKKRIATIIAEARDDKKNWIFGASNFTQPLFLYGLDEEKIFGVLDNSPIKHDKRLYGTSLMCRKPESVLVGDNHRVFLNLGYYNQEVYEQIIKLNYRVECIFL